MKGNNVLILNPATMVEALQLWLDKKMAGPAPTVTSVEQLSTIGAWGGQFEVRVTDEAQRP